MRFWSFPSPMRTDHCVGIKTQSDTCNKKVFNPFRLTFFIYVLKRTGYLSTLPASLFFFIQLLSSDFSNLQNKVVKHQSHSGSCSVQTELNIAHFIQFGKVSRKPKDPSSVSVFLCLRLVWVCWSGTSGSVVLLALTFLLSQRGRGRFRPISGLVAGPSLRHASPWSSPVVPVWSGWACWWWTGSGWGRDTWRTRWTGRSPRRRRTTPSSWSPSGTTSPAPAGKGQRSVLALPKRHLYFVSN